MPESLSRSIPSQCHIDIGILCVYEVSNFQILVPYWYQQNIKSSSCILEWYKNRGDISTTLVYTTNVGGVLSFSTKTSGPYTNTCSIAPTSCRIYETLHHSKSFISTFYSKKSMWSIYQYMVGYLVFLELPKDNYSLVTTYDNRAHHV